ncbi:hypothetical protein [Marinigracilibium pacificum]|uniref:Tetratricopeptide repeat protein n=1 Tax=Marinigracilibium pacificum TaxID=2729599 RepID=A0A848ISF2_9BACT|nr:hypothetical protein [Marinigracilibium pacificum]NMM47277.1 hypothetical protein [Marinigracilibium pacificum]
MKKQKLKKFIEYVSRLLPHEIQYLLDVQQFDDLENLTILRQINEYVNKNADNNIFSTHIDKRKYSRIMRWMQERLNSADVDAEFNLLIDLENNLMKDNLSPDQEKQLLKIINNTEQDEYYFMKRYELGLHFLNFLLVRMRHKEYHIIEDFINKYKSQYDHCRMVYMRIQKATNDIIQQYTYNDIESKQWESWLLTIFRDPLMDGMNRYYALVRLIFLYFNYNLQDKMEALFEEIDPVLASGKFYSRRILINYYGNRLLYHTKANRLDLAEKYGWLSISEKNSDHLHYVNNLTAVLLKMEKLNEALTLMQNVFPDVKKTSNFHHKTSFTAQYITALLKNGQYKEAAQHAEIFLMAHKNEILRHRWHLFFSVFFRSLFLKGDYKKILQYSQKLNLIEKERKYLKKTNSSAVIQWYSTASKYKTEIIEIDELNNFIGSFLSRSLYPEKQQSLYDELKIELRKKIPEAKLQ